MRPLLLLLLATLPASAGTIEARVTNARGGGIVDAVVYAEPEGKQLPPAKKTAVMDQKNRTFIPHVLPVQTGTRVQFPNSDDIRHHVYSFSEAKSFQLPLYKGTPANPEVFDRAGVVTLGCNIHDQMSAFIVIVDTPYFQKTAGNGRATLADVPAGRYNLHLWYPGMRTAPAPQAITVKDGEPLPVSFVIGRAANAHP